VLRRQKVYKFGNATQLFIKYVRPVLSFISSSSSSSSSFDLVARENSQTGVQILMRVMYRLRYFKCLGLIPIFDSNNDSDV